MEPTSSRMKCTAQKPCKVLNCPFLYFPKEDHTHCIQIDQLTSTDSGDEVPAFEEDSVEHFLNWVTGEGRMVINGNIFEHPSVSSYSQSEDIRDGLKCNSSCETDKNCYCYYEVNYVDIAHSLSL